MNVRKKPSHNKVFILIAPEFDEEFVVRCLCRMLDNGLSACLVGSTSKVLSGLRGIKLSPDFSLTQLDQFNLKDDHLLIIPGTRNCALKLLVDPRVHNLINKALEANGWVAVMKPMQQALAMTGLPISQLSPNFLKQGNMKTDDFIGQLIAQVAS